MTRTKFTSRYLAAPPFNTCLKSPVTQSQFFQPILINAISRLLVMSVLMDHPEQGSSRVLHFHRQSPPPEPVITVYVPTTTVTTSWLCSTTTTMAATPRDVGVGGGSHQVYLAAFLALGLFLLGILLFLLIASVCRAVGEHCSDASNRRTNVFSALAEVCVEKIANAVASWTGAIYTKKKAGWPKRCKCTSGRYGASRRYSVRSTN